MPRELVAIQLQVQPNMEKLLVWLKVADPESCNTIVHLIHLTERIGPRDIPRWS